VIIVPSDYGAKPLSIPRIMHRHVVLSLLALSFIAPALAIAGIQLDPVNLANPIDQFRYPPKNVYVLAIGINRYKVSALNLGSSAQDATAVLDAATRQWGIPTESVVHLSDEHATKAGIRQAIQQFALKSHAGDLFILTFSGQAFTRTKNGIQEGFLAPSDAVVPADCHASECVDESTFISGTLLNSWMTQMHAQRQIILLDTNKTDQMLPIFENRWRKESCAVGADASKRLLLITTHGVETEVPKYGGLLTWAFLHELNLLEKNGMTSAFRLQQGLYETNDPGPQSDPTLVAFHKETFQTGSGFRAELLGGDFVINGPASGVPTSDLLRESGLGALCYNDPNDAGASRGLEDVKEKSTDDAATQSKKQTNYALVIASDHYKSWHSLSNPIYDATTIETDLSGTYGFQVEHLWDPSRDQLRHKLDELHAKHFNDQDQLFIFIAGHGDYDETNDIGYLVFPDTPLGHVYDSEMNLQELRQRIDTIPAKHIFLVMDSCFAGSLDPSLGGASRGAYDPIPLEKLEQRSADKKTRYFLTSGGKEYVPDGTPGNHSPFASLFILALEKGSKPAGYLNLPQMPHYFERLGTIPRAGNLGHNEDGADFFFIPTATAPATDQ
jgi:hypothetical protein